MKSNDLKLNQYRFERAVKHMPIPEDRKAGNSSNAGWFLRNGAILNRGHPKLDDAITYAQRLAV